MCRTDARRPVPSPMHAKRRQLPILAPFRQRLHPKRPKLACDAALPSGRPTLPEYGLARPPDFHVRSGRWGSAGELISEGSCGRVFYNVMLRATAIFDTRTSNERHGSSN